MTVHIVYPIDGASYPIIDPKCKIKSAYFTASFSVTCEGGPHYVSWGFDGKNLAEKVRFYDMFSAQFVWKLEHGEHKFHVESDCGEAVVEFQIAA